MMTEVVMPIPVRVPAWVGWITSALLGLGALFTVITSNTFEVTVTDPPAFPGCEGFGCETIGGRGGYVCIVKNTNSSGADSFTECMMDTSPRIIIFRVSGVITVGTSSNEINPALAQSNVTVLGQTAPGDGIMLKPFSTGRIIRFGEFETPANNFNNGVFQHIRFRLVPGTGGLDPNDGSDSFLISAGSHHIVFDHIESLWTSDESFNFVGNDITDITVSRSIIGEAGLAQNLGPLLDGAKMRRQTWHHNLFIHTQYRNPIYQTKGAAIVNTGVELINNVLYNHSRFMCLISPQAIGDRTAFTWSAIRGVMLMVRMLIIRLTILVKPIITQ
jgi:pectate lyase